MGTLKFDSLFLVLSVVAGLPAFHDDCHSRSDYVYASRNDWQI